MESDDKHTIDYQSEVIRCWIDVMKRDRRYLTIRVRMSIIIQYSLMNLFVKIFPICEEIMSQYDPDQLIVDFGYTSLGFYISLNPQRAKLAGIRILGLRPEILNPQVDKDYQGRRVGCWSLHGIEESVIQDFLMKIPDRDLDWFIL